jgi:CBS domain-containing protein
MPRMSQGLRAGDVMRRDVISVPETMDLRDLAKLFLERGITGAPVVDGDGALKGVISQTDLVYYHLTRGDELVLESSFYHHAKVEGRPVPRGFQFEDFNSGNVADVMTPIVHSVSEAASVDSVSRLMMRNHIHRVIVRRGNRLVGIISALDILARAPKAKPKPRAKPKPKPKPKPKARPAPRRKTSRTR